MLAPQCFAYGAYASDATTEAQAMQAADILGIRPHVERLRSMQASGEEAYLLKSLVLRKVLRGILEVRQACNKIDLELAYAYDVMKNQERHERFVAELFNIANFAQLSTLYTMEPFFRIQKQFVTSAIFTTTGGSLSILITLLSKLHARTTKASHVAPPEILHGMVDGKPVDTRGLPPLVERFLDSRAPNSDTTRREDLFAMWKSRYNVDASKEKSLCGIADKNKVRTSLLGTRILLLWSLHTFVQDFDKELLSLVKLLKTEGSNVGDVTVSKAGSSGLQVAHFLGIQSQVEELIALKQSNTVNDRRDELELLVLERLLEGALEVQVASDKVDEELNYNYHVVLSDLLESRAKWLQYNYDLNFIQSGVMGIVAGGLYLSRFSHAGDRQFVIAGGVGAGLTTLAILQMHGFWRKADTGPNSLAAVFKLQPQPGTSYEYRFSPFVSSFLNSVPPDSTDGKTRCETLNEHWEQRKVTTVNLKREKNLKALANTPPHRYDTIKIATNRNVLLHSLKKELESFHGEVLDLLRITQ